MLYNDWLAGLLEGEGCFYIQRTPSIRIAMTDRDTIERVSKMWGSNIYEVKKRENRKLQYVTTLHGNPAIECMNSIYKLMSNRRKERIDEVLRLAAARPGKLKGIAHPNSKLNPEAVKAIRHACKSKTDKAVAAAYGIARSTVQKVRVRRLWRHV